MSSRVTIGLVVVLIALAIGAYFSNKTGAGGATPTPTPNNALFTFQPTDVKSLQIDYQGKSITVEQTADHNWKLTNPPAQYSDSTHIAGVVATLTNMQKQRDVPMGNNPPSAFGLDKPYLTVTVTLNDGSQHTLVAGNKNPGGDGYYAQIKGQNALYIVATIDIDSLAQLVAQPPIATPTAATTPLATVTPNGSPSPTPAGTPTP